MKRKRKHSEDEEEEVLATALDRQDGSQESQPASPNLIYFAPDSEPDSEADLHASDSDDSTESYIPFTYDDQSENDMFNDDGDTNTPANAANVNALGNAANVNAPGPHVFRRRNLVNYPIDQEHPDDMAIWPCFFPASDIIDNQRTIQNFLGAVAGYLGPDVEKPEEFFALLVGDYMFHLMAEKTNEYASRKISGEYTFIIYSKGICLVSFTENTCTAKNWTK